MERTELRLALVQANPTVGDIAGNLALAKSHIDAQSDVDLIVFGECFLSGYPIEDLAQRPSFIARVEAALDDLAAYVRERGGPGVLIGAPIRGTDRPFNAAVLIGPDGTARDARKCELPNNDVFDERRDFAHGTDPKPLPFEDFRLGVMVCEDMWHRRVTDELAGELADALIVINGSPFELGKQAVRIAHARRRVQTSGLPLLYLNMVGGQDEVVFDGASFVLDRMGREVALLPAFHDGVLRLKLVRNPDSAVDIEIDGQPMDTHVLYPDRLEAIYHACVLGLRDYIQKNQAPRVFLGVSGGIDSALVATLAVDALGPERVTGIMLPSEHTGSESLALAEDLFARLGCAHGSIAIKDMAAAAGRALQAAIEAEICGPGVEPSASGHGLALENIQSRARGQLLMALSNAFGGLVLSTGNKSEMLVGYATLYGDMCGGYNPIKDIYKTVVFELCRWRNENYRSWMIGGKQPIPDGIITRPPTAELRPDQTDEAALGSYDQLDAVLQGLVERDLDPVQAARHASMTVGRAIDTAYAERIARLVQASEYKRRQAPPGIKITARSLGKGRRYPITNRGSL